MKNYRNLRKFARPASFKAELNNLVFDQWMRGDPIAFWVESIGHASVPDLPSPLDQLLDHTFRLRPANISHLEVGIEKLYSHHSSHKPHRRLEGHISRPEDTVAMVAIHRTKLSMRSTKCVSSRLLNCMSMQSDKSKCPSFLKKAIPQGE